MLLNKCKSIGCNGRTLTSGGRDFCSDCEDDIAAGEPLAILTETIKPLGVQLSLDMERDPNGKDQHQPGAKADAGKPRPALVLGGFARALMAVTKIGTFGAAKYTDNGWMEVLNGQARYDDAKMRHWLYDKMGVAIDPDSMELHMAHEAWNSLARLDLYLRERETKAALA